MLPITSANVHKTKKSYLLRRVYELCDRTRMEIEAGYTYGLIDAGKEIVLIGQELKRIDEKNS
jgi:hypothetical protein